MKPYKTIKTVGAAEVIEKKSKFIASAATAATEAIAMEHLSLIKKQHADASHNVFAYRIGGVERFSDDGEPGGTAGLPILDVLKGNALENAIVVVTRYFGGTLLGKGGLKRAYSLAAREAIKAAGIVEMRIYHRYSVTVDYQTSGRLQYFIETKELRLVDTIYTDKVEFIVALENDEARLILGQLTDISDGRALIAPRGSGYEEHCLVESR